MIQKINSTSFKGSILLRASKGDTSEPQVLQQFDTDYIRDICKLPSNDTVIVYTDTIEGKQSYFVPSKMVSTNEIINAYTAACQHRNIIISLN